MNIGAKRNTVLDSFKLIAALFILAVHCGFLFDYNTTAFQLTSNGFFRIAVPFFYCINGFYLLDVFVKKSIKKWLMRVTLLYAVWMIIYSFFWIPIVVEEPIKFINFAVFGFNHLWYLIALVFGGFLLFKLKNRSNIFLICVALPLFFSGLIIQYLGIYSVFEKHHFLNKLVNYPNTYRNFLFFVFPLLSLGYLIRRNNLHQRLKMSFAIIFLIIGCAIVFLEHYINYVILDTETLRNTNLAYVILCPTLLILSFKFNKVSNHNRLAQFAIAIYLIHPFVIFIISKFIKLDTITLTIFTTLSSFILGFFIIKLNSKLKFIL